MVGRKDERARLKALLDAAREGRSGTLLLHGPPGIGKTESLRWLIAEAADFTVLRARGMESESDIPFAGLAELITPLLGHLDELPAVQAAALRGALALGPATPTDRFTVPAALLSLLARAADERPVLAVIDDAQWLDDPSLEAFLFAGRRLGQEGVVMIGAARDQGRQVDMPWLERLCIEPLREEDARALLDDAIAPGVADRLVATAAGNPLALLEIPGLLSPAQLAGREPLEDPLRPGTNVERAFANAIEALPEATRRALLIAAAASTRRLDAIARAGVSLADLEPAEEARIVTLAEGELDFRHPLMRSTVYHAASQSERRSAHAALAEAAEGAERAWHLAACAVAPDESVAAALEQAALDARGRGAHSTAMRDLGRAAQLTPDPDTRARRLLAAAGDAVRSAAAERALGMLDEAAALTDDPLLLADAERLRGHVELRRGSPAAAYERLVREADRVRSRDPRRAAAMFLEASVAHMVTGDFRELIESAERARALSAGTEPAVELLATAVIGAGQVALGDVEPGVAALEACAPYLMEADPLAHVEIVGLAGQAAVWVEDWDGAARLLSRLLGAARDASAVSALIHPLSVTAHLDLRRGRWAAALAGASEAVELAEDTGSLALLPHALAALTLVEAALGHEADCRAHVERGLAVVPGEGVHLHAALGLLELGLGRIPEAIEALETAERGLVRRGVSSAVVPMRPDLVEAYIRAGRREEAEAALERLEENSLWARATAARCRGLLAPDDEVRPAFDAALALHDELPMPFEKARTQLALGERLRRAKQRAEAREPLTAALDAFERLGARPWAERARTELRATGGPAGARRAQAAAEQLTPHELQIAVLVSQGMTNREAAAALFLSPKTIEYHLGQIYRKLDVRGRAQLARLMAMELPEGERDPAVLSQ
ncbi:MAG TPA: AAA family ATPase [Solirubrobacter sp.]|nr:AAA family ATPase [Solirubrobacter sp.]